MRVGRNLRLAHALQSHHVFKSERAPGLRQRKAAQKENQYARPHGNSSKADKCSGLGMQGVCEENHAEKEVARTRADPKIIFDPEKSSGAKAQLALTQVSNG